MMLTIIVAFAKLRQKIRKVLFNDNYSYVYYDSYLPGERRLVPGNIDFSTFTKLCAIMKKKGSDKGFFVGMSRHNYTPLYYKIFKKFKKQNINFFELGIGSTNINIAANMGKSGIPGASLFGWKEFFPEANIYSADIDKSILFQEERIKTFFCDQTNPQIIQSMWNDIGPIQFNIIVDDGLHEFNANVCFFENSIHKLCDGGIYIIEDVLRDQFENWIAYFKKYSLKDNQLRFTLLQIPNSFNQHDNNIIAISKSVKNNKYKHLNESIIYLT